MINKVILIGNLTRDPEIQDVKNGKMFTVGLATEESYKDKSGEWASHTEFHDLTTFGPLAENLFERGMEKGQRVYVEGKITYNKTDKGKFTNIIIRNMRRLNKTSK